MRPRLLTLFICFFSFLRIKSGPTKPQLILTRVGQCHGKKYSKSLVQFSEMSITGNPGHYYVTGFLTVEKDVVDGWSVTATKQKCMDMRNVDTCDFLRNFVVMEFACAADESGAVSALRELFNHTKPRMSCPVQAGFYKVDNYSIQMRDSFYATSEAKISTSVFGYTLKFEGFDVDDEDRILCLEVYLQLAYPRYSPIDLELDLESTDAEETTEDSDTAEDDVD